MESGGTHVTNRTFRNYLRRQGYRYLQSRKKGLLLATDLKARLKYARKVKRNHLGQEFWNTAVLMYVDGKGLEFKTNPQDMMRAPHAREWRLRGEGLRYRCTAKGSKEGAVNVNFMVGISYGSGVFLCEQHEGPITGQRFADIVTTSFPAALEKNAKAGRKCIKHFHQTRVSIV